MAKIERLREAVGVSPSLEYFAEKSRAGWKLAAVEWEREVEGEEKERGAFLEDVPYGLRVSEDCLHLEEDAVEKQVLTLMLELLVRDRPFSGVAEELNQRGFRTRQGTKWTTVSVFNMLPRLIEVGPRIFASQEWTANKKRLLTVAWTS